MNAWWEEARLFAAEEPLVLASAPGRLDVMGGIADYSGSLVLQIPVHARIEVALQRRPDRELRIVSLGERLRTFGMSLDELEEGGRAVEEAAVRARLGGEASQRWAGYVAGGFWVLMREGIRFGEGANLVIRSDVPAGAGLGSSAALEVATMRAICERFGIPLEAREMALLCQRIENDVVGAACGIMDQMTAACGRSGHLMALRCRPCELEGFVPVPPGIVFYGVDSGARHSVAGSAYGTVRAAAFMGRRMLADSDPGRSCGYLTDWSPEEIAPEELPAELAGADFLARYVDHGDRATAIEPDTMYPIRVATLHAVEERARVERFRQALLGAIDRDTLAELGDLMFASHESYSACNLGSSPTDAIVERVRRERAAGRGVWGARVTGGGSGGTVAILAECDHADAALARIATGRPIVRTV